jgi:hypothetical protein
MLLEAALEDTIGGLGGVIVSCIPGRLAYFDGEDIGDWYILERSE